MYTIYIDDSGDPGLKSKGSPTHAFALTAVVVSDIEWLNVLDALVDFRRYIRDAFGVRVGMS